MRKGGAHVLVDGGVTHKSERNILQALARRQMLENGHQITERLTWMQVGTHAVDDGDGRMLPKLGNLVIMARADLDSIQQAGHDKRRILHRLGFAQMDFTGTQVERMATELGHGHLEGDARTRGRLVEDHAQAHTLEQRRAAAQLVGTLQHAPEFDKLIDLLVGIVGQIQKMSHHGNLLRTSPPRGAVRRQKPSASG